MKDKKKAIKSISNDQHAISYESEFEQQKAKEQELKNNCNNREIKVSALNSNFWGSIG